MTGWEFSQINEGMFFMQRDNITHQPDGSILTLDPSRMHQCCRGCNRGPLLTRSCDIGALLLSVRAMNCLEIAGLTTIARVSKKTASELLAIKNLGETTLEEIREALEKHGFHLRGE